MSHFDKKSRKIFDFRESLRDKWKLVFGLYDESRHEFNEQSLWQENREGFTRMLNELSDSFDAQIKKKKEIDVRDVKAYLIIYYGLVKYHPQVPPMSFDTNFGLTACRWCFTHTQHASRDCSRQRSHHRYGNLRSR